MDVEETHTFVGENASEVQVKLRKYLVDERGMDEIRCLDHLG
jgi:hypothetical protein